MSFFKKSDVIAKANVSIINNSKEKIIWIYKHQNGKYSFGDDKTQYNLLTAYWNGFNNHDVEVIPGKTVTKSKHGLLRAATGGLIAGAPGAIVGAVTSKKVSTTQKPVTINMGDPQNLFLVFENDKTKEKIQQEIQIDFKFQLEQLEKKFGLKTKFSE